MAKAGKKSGKKETKTEGKGKTERTYPESGSAKSVKKTAKGC